MKLTLNSEKMMSLALGLFAAYAAALLPTEAYASLSEPSALSDVLCSVVGWFTGTIGAGIATLAIIIIGVGALMGKVSWGMAIIVGIGVAVIFGAPGIVMSLSGNATGCA
jgi:type IV secretory pathway VirB2 component (pilin)